MNHPILWKYLTKFCKLQLLKIMNLNPKGDVFGVASTLRIMHEKVTKGNGNKRMVHERMGWRRRERNNKRSINVWSYAATFPERTSNRPCIYNLYCTTHLSSRYRKLNRSPSTQNFTMASQNEGSKYIPSCLTC